jgi:hypothetical protein
MTPRDATAVEIYRTPIRRRVRRFIRDLWRFLTGPSPF